MIFITARFRVRPEHADEWPRLAATLTDGTRAEPGCLFYEWSRSIEDRDVYVLVEGFRDAAAGAAHVNSEHFASARRELPAYLAETPDIVNVSLDQHGWSKLAEFEVPAQA